MRSTRVLDGRVAGAGIRASRTLCTWLVPAQGRRGLKMDRELSINGALGGSMIVKRSRSLLAARCL